jgi:hypothetical protein
MTLDGVGIAMTTYAADAEDHRRRSGAHPRGTDEYTGPVHQHASVRSQRHRARRRRCRAGGQSRLTVVAESIERALCWQPPWNSGANKRGTSRPAAAANRLRNNGHRTAERVQRRAAVLDLFAAMVR